MIADLYHTSSSEQFLVSIPRGSAWANTISQYVQAILLFFYIVWRKLYVDTWGGTDHKTLSHVTSNHHLDISNAVLVELQFVYKTPPGNLTSCLSDCHTAFLKGLHRA